LLVRDDGAWGGVSSEMQGTVPIRGQGIRGTLMFWICEKVSRPVTRTCVGAFTSSLEGLDPWAWAIAHREGKGDKNSNGVRTGKLIY